MQKHGRSLSAYKKLLLLIENELLIEQSHDGCFAVCEVYLICIGTFNCNAFFKSQTLVLLNIIELLEGNSLSHSHSLSNSFNENRLQLCYSLQFYTRVTVLHRPA